MERSLDKKQLRTLDTSLEDLIMDEAISESQAKLIRVLKTGKATVYRFSSLEARNVKTEDVANLRPAQNTY